MKPQISLLVCTIGRTSELKRLLVSLEAQTYRSFEIVLVDQNDDDRLDSILHEFQQRLPIIRLQSGRGLSHGRNIGLTKLRGAIIAFPDDDCEYPPNLLAQIITRFEELPDVAGLCGRHIDEDGQNVLARFDSRRGYISPINLWRRSSSATIFLRNTVVENVGLFDEQLGAGSGTPWGAAEESDYLCRALKMEYRLLYDPELVIPHPRPPIDNSPAARKRAGLYGRGMGFVLRKHNYPLWFTGYMVVRPTGGASVDLLRGRIGSARLRWHVARARAAGYGENRSANASPVQSDGQNGN
jgi:glycosyltransferase involved in cell wall biosynthesis